MIAHVENPSARIRLQMVPVSTPGNCGICGTGQHILGFVDPQLDFEFYGALIFCVNCVGEMATIYGFISPEVYEDIVGELDLVKMENRLFQQKILELEKAIDSFGIYFDRRSTDSSGSSGVLPPQDSEELSIASKNINESSGESTPPTIKSEPSPSTSERAPSKFVSGEGFLNI